MDVPLLRRVALVLFCRSDEMAAALVAKGMESSITMRRGGAQGLGMVGHVDHWRARFHQTCGISQPPKCLVGLESGRVGRKAGMIVGVVDVPVRSPFPCL